MVKRKGSKFSKDEERVSKRRLRSGRIIETLTSPLRPTKEAVTASTNPRVKPFNSSKSALKIVHVIDNEDVLDETELPSSHLSNETNMNWISADMGLVEKKGVSKAKSSRKAVRGIIITLYLPLSETNAICR